VRACVCVCVRVYLKGANKLRIRDSDTKAINNIHINIHPETFNLRVIAETMPRETKFVGVLFYEVLVISFTPSAFS
jgi:hypothetical protein